MDLGHRVGRGLQRLIGLVFCPSRSTGFPVDHNGLPIAFHYKVEFAHERFRQEMPVVLHRDAEDLGYLGDLFGIINIIPCDPDKTAALFLHLIGRKFAEFDRRLFPGYLVDGTGGM